MAENKVRKGFFFYLMLFLGFLIGAFAVCVTIMFFNPGKSVLGLKYFNHSEAYEVTTAEGGNALNLGSKHYSEIRIDAGVVNVRVEANDESNKDCILIKNNIKGFAKASEEDIFDFSVKEEPEGVLSIKVDASKGFLNFSNDATLSVHLAHRSGGDIDIFQNTKFIIKTTSGYVNIGGITKAGYTNNIYIGGLDIETESGGITLSSQANGGDRKFVYNSDLSFKTKSGVVDLTACDTTTQNQVGTSVTTETAFLTISDSYAFNANIGKGRLKISKAKAKDFNITAKGGRIEISDFQGNLNASVVSTIMALKTINGDLDFSRGNAVMDGNRITAEKVTGVVNVPDGRGSIMTFNEIGKESNIRTTSGSVKIGTESKPLAKSVYVETTNGNVTAYFGNQSVTRVLKTERGEITADFVNDLTIGNKNSFISQYGNINVNFGRNSKIKFNFKDLNSEEFNLDNVTFDVLSGKKMTSNPYLYNTTGANATINIVTSRRVVLDLN